VATLGGKKNMVINNMLNKSMYTHKKPRIQITQGARVPKIIAPSHFALISRIHFTFSQPHAAGIF
jgi:hypothetical protein